MRLKKWENPKVTSLNVELTKSCTYDYPHAWHCNTCNLKVEEPKIVDGTSFLCPSCNNPLQYIGCTGTHPS